MTFWRRSRPAVVMVSLACAAVGWLGAAGVAEATTVYGQPNVGSTIYAVPDLPSDSVSWYDCNAQGATLGAPVGSGPSYTVVETDVGSYLCAVDTTSNPPTSNMTTAAAADPSDGGPVITGTAQQGDTLSVAYNGHWYDPPNGYGYQWCQVQPGGACNPIAGANASSYTLQASDVGADVELEETPVYNGQPASGATTRSADGDDVAPATPATPAPRFASGPTISGTAALGDTLTASPGSSADGAAQYSYQWLTCAMSCTPIAGATGSTLRLGDGQIGSAVAVAVTAVNAGGSSRADSPRTAVVSAPTELGLLVPSASVHVNQGVSLEAIVTSSVDTVDPDGTVTFDDGGTPIPGCTDESVDATTQSVAVGCATSFGLSSPSITATYAQGAGSPLTGSATGSQTVTVVPDGSTVTLDTPDEVKRGTSVTYTASVVPADDLSGPVVPGGAVRFEQNGRTIRGCGDVGLSDGGATCTTRYRDTGTEHVIARYEGSTSFHPAISSRRAVKVLITLPTANGRRPAGSISSTMQWTFHYTPRFTRILAFVVHGLPSRSEVTVGCAGRGCPYRSRVHQISDGHPTLGLVSAFRGRRLGVDARVTITVTRQRYVGEYYRFTVRASHQPSVLITCLAPGSVRPGVGCRR